MKVGPVLGIIDDELIDRDSFGAHRLDVQVKLDPGRAELFDNLDGIRRVVEKVAFAGPSGSIASVTFWASRVGITRSRTQAALSALAGASFRFPRNCVVGVIRAP